MNDDQWLAQYAHDGSPAAFEQIVATYAGMVYAAARRQVTDTHLAEDVVQAVFLLLTKKARGIGGPGRLPGWLVRTTHFVSKEALRQTSRRARRERKAAQMTPAYTQPSDQTALDELGPALDAALTRLREVDRNVVVLRYLRGHTLEEIARTGGTTEDAARKRIERALLRLRSYMERSGTCPSSAALPGILAAAAGKPAATELVTSVTNATVSGGNVAAHALARGTLSRTLMLKAAAGGACLTMAVIATTAFWYWQASEPSIVRIEQAPSVMKGRTYQADLNSAIGPEWSFRQTTIAPTGGTPFLGEVTDVPLALTISSMPKHEHLRVTFDLLVMMSWDGSGIHTGAGATVGPDTWDMRVAGGPMLVWQTFSNHPDDPGFADELKLQSYPSPVPGDKLPKQTGAAERQALGYTYDATPEYKFPMDAVYHMTVVFPHTAGDVHLQFAGLGRGKSHAQYNGKNDASWGLRNVKVEALDTGSVPLLDDTSAHAALERAIGPDPVDANRAFWELATGGDAVRKVMLAAQAAVPPVDHIKARQLIESASHTVKKSPEAAAVEEAFLTQIGPLGEIDLWDALRREPSPAFRRKIEPVVRAMVRTELKDPALRRAGVAGRVLEIIGKPPAR